jgi:long-chain fatty acid transport protein
MHKEEETGMQRRNRSLWLAGVLCLLTTLVGAPLTAAGFSLLFENGAKSMGVAGAFTATADDPSAMFYNVGGLSFLKEREFQTGLTLVTSSGPEFSGAAPYPGEGVVESGASLSELLPHFYWVQPFNDRWTAGFALNSPYGLVSEWDPEGFSGRYISTKGSLMSVDLSANFGYQVSERLGVGFGAILRLTEVELNRYQGAVNPFTGDVADIADVALESDLETAEGWHVGLLHRVNNSLSWGASYRSSIEMDLEGDARFTQLLTGNPQFDGLVGTLLPFGTSLPISTSIEFPSSWSIGAAIALSKYWRVEVDYNWTEWSTFQSVVVDFGGALPDSVIGQHWDDVNNYRIGFRHVGSGRNEWRFGYVLDETPQPDETTGPLLPDSDRDGFTIGFGHQGQKLSYDLALLYLMFDERTTLVNETGFNGTWETEGLLLATSIGW